ncbi:hypothetical protein E05_37620 [Plautia stali symbiont]|nr:hypothetical protein E05_37620 [Plautia stali symbiont]
MMITLPAAAEGAVEIDLRQQQRVFHRHNIQLGAEQRALRIKLIEIGRIAILITVARNPPRLGKRSAPAPATLSAAAGCA